MVNNASLRRLVVGQYKLSKQSKDDDRRRVRNGPIFELSVVKELVREHGVRILNTNAQRAMLTDFDPPLEDSEIQEIIVHALRHDDEKTHYVEAEVCKANGMVVDCDAYSIRWNRIRHKESNCSRAIYLKFGFKENRPICLIVRVHPDKYK